MRLQNVFTLLALLALAALVFIVVRSLSAPKPQPQTARVEQPAQRGKYPQIYVARENLEVGSFIDANDLEARDWPEQAILPAQVRADQVQPSEIVGSVVRNRMVKGEPILRENLVKPGDRSFLAAALTPGMRAVTIPIDNISGHSGLLLQGDRVDVILTQNVASATTAAQARVGETILRAVRVIAINSTMAAPQNTETVDDHPRSVTLEVTPKQAEAVAVARELGTLSLALRSLPQTESDEMEDELATTGADLSKSTAPTWGGNVSKALGGTNVQVMRGGSGSKQ